MRVDGTPKAMDDDDDRSPHDHLPDPDGEPAYSRPLDIALILDGIDPEDPEDDEHPGTALDGAESPHDDAGDVSDQGDDAEDLDDAPSAGQRYTFQAWQVILATRDDAGQWSTVGEPVADARFDTMAVAHGYAETRNKRDFGWRFDWTKDPPRAWVAVREGHRGALRINGEHSW